MGEQDGWTLRPDLEQKLARLQELERPEEAAVVRRCIQLIKAGTPQRAVNEWNANRRHIDAALGDGGN